MVVDLEELLLANVTSPVVSAEAFISRSQGLGYTPKTPTLCSSGAVAVAGVSLWAGLWCAPGRASLLCRARWRPCSTLHTPPCMPHAARLTLTLRAACPLQDAARLVAVQWASQLLPPWYAAGKYVCILGAGAPLCSDWRLKYVTCALVHTWWQQGWGTSMLCALSKRNMHSNSISLAACIS